MDLNLKKERIAGFLGQSYVLIPRKVLTMLFHGEGREIGRASCRERVSSPV